MKIANFDLEKDGTFIIAELSANHNGSLQNALDSIKAAKQIGANAVKLQTYTADTITLDCKNSDFKISQGTLWDGKYLYDLYKEAYTPWEWHKQLFDYAKELGIIIFSSPFDKSAVDLLESLNAPAYKIASFEITDYELIEYTAKKMKPMIISTGIASIDEIQDAVDICRSVGNNDIVLLKCTSAYPAPLEEANLLTIPNLAQTFGVTAGFSDHTLGLTAPIVAITLGAKVLEKHFILDKSIGGPDCEFSMEKEEFEQLIKEVRNTEKLLGKVDYTLTQKRKKSRKFSRSLYSCKEIKKGEFFTRENIKSVRPGYGLHPKYLDEILGKKANKNIEFGKAISLSDFE